MEEDKLEERKKAIERFSINRSSDEESTVEENVNSYSIPDKNIIFHDEVHVNDDQNHDIEDFDLDINSKEFFYKDESEEKKATKKKKTSVFIIIILALFAVSNLLYKYVSLSVNNVPVNKEYAALEQIKEIPAPIKEKEIEIPTSIISETDEAIKVTDEAAKIKEDLIKKQSQIALLEDRKATLQRTISSLDNKKNQIQVVHKETKNSSNKNSISDDSISKVWKISEVNDYGQSVVLQMIGHDRYITVSIGDTILDAGLIRSIRKTNGKWIVNGLKKRVE